MEIQRRRCEAVAAHISARLSIQTSASGEPDVRISRQRHDYYVKGLYHWRKHTITGWHTAVEWFAKSIAVDDSFAPAFAGLAHATYAVATLNGVMPIGGYLTARNATARALALDPALADAHAVDARLKWSPEWDMPGAEAAFQRSLELNSSSSEVNFWYALYLIAELSSRTFWLPRASSRHFERRKGRLRERR
jgi:hypothetical protein